MKTALRYTANVLLGMLIGIAAIMVTLMVVVPRVSSLQCYVITSGSMTGTIDRGSLIYDKTVPVKSLVKGDIITYSPPGNLPLVTHRIFSVEHDPDGTPLFVTKGDFNPGPDPWKFKLNGATQAKYSFHIPLIGYVFAVLSLPSVRIAVLSGPAFVIAVVILNSVWSEAGEELRRREAEASESDEGEAVIDPVTMPKKRRKLWSREVARMSSDE